MVHHMCVLRSEMSALHRLYFDEVYKILIPRKEHQSEASYLDLILMELLDSEIPINLASLIIKHMQRVFVQENNGHTLLYRFWLADILKAYFIPVHVWTMQTTKNV